MFVTTGLSKCTVILKFVITKYNLLVATTPAPPPHIFSRVFCYDLFHHRLFHNYTC